MEDKTPEQRVRNEAWRELQDGRLVKREDMSNDVTTVINEWRAMIEYIDELEQENDDLREENKRLREALEEILSPTNPGQESPFAMSARMRTKQALEGSEK